MIKKYLNKSLNNLLYKYFNINIQKTKKNNDLHLIN